MRIHHNFYNVPRYTYSFFYYLLPKKFLVCILEPRKKLQAYFFHFETFENQILKLVENLNTYLINFIKWLFFPYMCKSTY